MIVKSIKLISNILSDDIEWLKENGGKIVDTVVKKSPYDIKISRKKKGNKNDKANTRTTK
tara:strand:- start:1488 stop:1667 length:180 start_codon:yes stop_codon:yes gene_type:complete